MSDDIPLSAMFGVLAVMLVLSAFFSGSETALMRLNRYRLRHRASEGHRAAQLAEKLLERPDRLIGLILLGNNLVNFAAVALVTLVAMRIGGEPAVIVATVVLTVVGSYLRKRRRKHWLRCTRNELPIRPLTFTTRCWPLPRRWYG